MKLKLMVTFASFLLAIHSINGQTPTSQQETTLIKKLLESPEAQSTKINGKTVILTTKYCKNYDCTGLLKGHSNEVLLFSREDAFMRKIDNYIEIINVDTATKSIFALLRMGDKTSNFSITN